MDGGSNAGGDNASRLGLGGKVVILGGGIMTAPDARVISAQQAHAAGLAKAARFMSAPLFVVLVDPVSRQYGKPAVILMVAAASLVFFLIMLARKLTVGKIVPAPLH